MKFYINEISLENCLKSYKKSRNKFFVSMLSDLKVYQRKKVIEKFDMMFKKSKAKCENIVKIANNKKK